MNKEINLSVTQVCNYIKSIFEAEEMLIGISIFGEITNLKKSGKAIYFDLKDENSSLACVVFDEQVLNAVDFGNQVVVKGRFNFYSKMGKLSFVVSNITKFGVGELFAKYLELKNKLEKEGLFDEGYKKQIPQYAKRIGVVSSETGAVIRDIIKVARTKNLSVDIVLYPAKVQGVGALNEIINGIKYFDNYDVDVIIVARGGGSFEDYQPFNTEDIARAVFQAKKPIISAVGHENDWTIIDFVADLRASTPSVASEMAVFDEIGLFNRISSVAQMSYNKLVQKSNENITNITNIVKHQNLLINHSYEKYKNSIISSLEKCTYNINYYIKSKMQSCQILATQIEEKNPLKVLLNGYSKIEKDNKAVVSIKDLIINDVIEMKLIDGNVVAEVKGIKEDIKYGLR